MRNDKQQAIDLRKSGKSYNEIRQRLNIPKSTLSDWLYTAEWSNKIKVILTEQTKETHRIRLRDLALVQRAQLYQIYEEAKEEAYKEFRLLRLHPLFIAGISL